MISTIIWNVRGINTQGVMEGIKKFKNIYHLAIISIVDPFVDSSNVMSFNNKQAMKKAIARCNGKIWLFLNGDFDYVVKNKDEQQITCDFIDNEL